MSSRIHLLTHEFAPYIGGIGTYVEELAGAYARAGYAPTVWAPDYGGEDSTEHPFTVKRIRMRATQGWPSRLKMAGAVRSEFVNGSIEGMLVLAEPGPIRTWMYSSFLRLPQARRLAIILHGSEVQHLGESSRRWRRLGRLLGQADVVGVVSHEVEKMTLDYYPELADKILRVPGAVRHAWKSLPAVPERKLDGPREILVVGRLHPRKGQLFLLETVAGMPAEVREKIRIRLIGPVGKVAYAEKINALVNENNLPVVREDSIDLDSLRRAYERAAMLIMPSQPFKDSIEGLGLALLEAQHFGCPVIGSRLGGIPEALREGISGLLVSPQNTGELAHAIEELLHDPQKAEKMGRAGAEFVRRGFSWTANTKALTGNKNSF